MLIKQELDAWLDQVSYSELNSTELFPSTFALTFMNFIKLANGEQGESHKTPPPVHFKMLDKVVESKSDYIANLCTSASGEGVQRRTTLFMEYFSLFLGMFGFIHPGLRQGWGDDLRI
jgi:hypothetical protein